MNEEDKAVYKQAMKRIDELVEQVMQTCDEVADENHYDRIWVMERFRDRFNQAKRKI